MTEPQKPETQQPDSARAVTPAVDDPVASVLRLAGPRAAVPPDRMRRVRAAVHDQWQQQGRARARRMAMAWSVSAVAAAALLLVGVRLAVNPGPAPQSLPAVLATIEVLSGSAHLMSSTPLGGEPATLQVGDRLREGDGVDTTAGGPAALRLAGGASVRIDRSTRLRLLSDTSLALDQGTIYIDSGARPGDRPLEVRTPLGVARDVGTRFEVRFDGSSLRVRVRDGLVQLAQSRQSHDLGPGDELTLDGEGHIGRRLIAGHAADWAWAAALAPPFDLEGRSVLAFVEWIAGENGWQVRFADPGVERKAQTTTVHGSIRGLTSEDALAAVLLTSGLEHRLDNGVLEIRQGAGGLKD